MNIKVKLRYDLSLEMIKLLLQYIITENSKVICRKLYFSREHKN